MRIAFGVEYDGRPFRGWQHQGHAPTVQRAVEEALSRVADHPVRVHAAGRTDTGVHALGQVVHIDTPADRPMRGWLLGGNGALPESVALRWATPVPDTFHARFSAQGRAYRYIVLNQPTRPALQAGRVTWECRALDVSRMQAAAALLIGRHDFTSYRSSECQARSPVRTVRRMSLSCAGACISLDVEADGFLHHMVRNVMGVLLAIGRGEAEPGWARRVLDARDRRAAAVTAPPDGLYLMHVQYDTSFGLPDEVHAVTHVP